jgi:CDP-paratose 2-epimerase
MIAELRGERLMIQFDKWRPGDQPWYISDIDALARAIGWQPRVRLREGLAALGAWFAPRFERTHRQERMSV